MTQVSQQDAAASRGPWRPLRVRRRDGATSRGVFVDTQAAYLESFKVDTWAEHERQHDRFTMADREIERQVLAYAIEPVEIKHFIYARDGIPPILPQVVALLAADS